MRVCCMECVGLELCVNLFGLQCCWAWWSTAQSTVKMCCVGGGRHSCIFKVVRACAFVVRNVKGWNCVENCLGCNVAEVDEMLSLLGPMICTLLYWKEMTALERKVGTSQVCTYWKEMNALERKVGTYRVCIGTYWQEMNALEMNVGTYQVCAERKWMHWRGKLEPTECVCAERK